MFRISDQEGGSFYAPNPALISPRISFSHDFTDTQKHEITLAVYKEAPVSEDFKFSVKNYAMRPADEIFFKGMLAPQKGRNGSNNCCTLRKTVTTLRDELLAGDEDEVESRDALTGFRSISGWWVERWGSKKNQNHGSKKLINETRSEEVLETVAEEKTSTFVTIEALITSKQEDL